MAEATMRWWRRWREILAWLAVEPLLPGATLIALLLWLSQHFLRDGFAHVRQYAIAASAGSAAVAIRAPRSWWSCTCATAGECRCLAGLARGLRRCCERMLAAPALHARAAC